MNVLHYDSMDVERLKQECSSHGIKYCHKMPMTKMIDAFKKWWWTENQGWSWNKNKMS